MKMFMRWYGSEEIMHGRAFITTLLLLVLVAAFKLFILLKRTGDAKNPPLPPGPLGLPVLGYLPFLRGDLHIEFSKLADTYGPIYKLWLGRKLYVVVNSPVLAKEIVREQDITFAHRSPNLATLIFSYGGKDIAFSDYGPYWKAMRKLFVREIMSVRILDACYSFRREEVRKSVQEVNKRAGTPVEIGKIGLVTMINVITAMLWGSTLDGLKAESAASEFKMASAKYIELVARPNISDLFPALSRFDLQGIAREAKEVSLWFDCFLDSVIECASKRVDEGRNSSNDKAEAGNAERRTDILRLILELLKKNDENSSPITCNTDLKGILLDIVVGGTDTTATTVEWVMAELLQHRDVMRTVVEELTEVVGMDCMPEEHHIPKLKYLKAVVKETVRLHPPLPLLIPRNPDNSCIVGGYIIPKGSTVFLNVGYIHKDHKLWDKPQDFIPERFLEDQIEFDFSGNNFVYMPFGSGRRMCPGIPLAQKMLMLVLASFLHSFHWELPEGTKLEFSDKMGIVVKKRVPLLAIPRPRLAKTGH